MLQLKKPLDLVISTGKATSVRKFIELSFQHIGKKIIWKGHGVNEKGYCKKTNKMFVKVSDKYFRPNEVQYLCGNSKLAKKKIGWTPKTNIKELVRIMMDYDLKYDDYGEDLT